MHTNLEFPWKEPLLLLLLLWYLPPVVYRSTLGNTGMVCILFVI